MEVLKPARRTTSIAISTAASRMSNPPSQSPAREKWRMTAISLCMSLPFPSRNAIRRPGTSPAVLAERAPPAKVRSSLRGRGQPKGLADSCIPFLGTFGATTLGPAREHRAFDEFLVSVGISGRDLNEFDICELAQLAGLLVR